MLTLYNFWARIKIVVVVVVVVGSCCLMFLLNNNTDLFCLHPSNLSCSDEIDSMCLSDCCVTYNRFLIKQAR